jgi:hypothetical protein
MKTKIITLLLSLLIFGSIASAKHVTETAVSIITSTVPAANISIPYMTTIVAQGGVFPYKFSQSAGFLPVGITLDSATGVLSGVPSAAGDFTFTITVTDSGGTAKHRVNTASKVYAILVDHIVKISWTASVTAGVTSYNIYVGGNGGPYTRIGNVLASQPSQFTDLDATSGNTYYYVATAIDPSGESVYSNQASITIPIP